jgi:hypothetical protein
MGRALPGNFSGSAVPGGGLAPWVVKHLRGVGIAGPCEAWMSNLAQARKNSNNRNYNNGTKLSQRIRVIKVSVSQYIVRCVTRVSKCIYNYYAASEKKLSINQTPSPVHSV